MLYYRINDTKGRISVDWKAIKTEYIAGGTSYRKLCEKYGVSRTTLQRKAKDEKWVELRSQVESKAETKIVDVLSKKQAKTTEKIIAVADKLLDKIEEIIDLVQDTQGIKHLTSAIKDIKDIKGFKCEADLREQEARIKKLEKDAQEEDNSLTEIRVTFGSNESEGTAKWAE
jgi:hypothetical protein